MAYKKRILETTIKDYLHSFPIVGITGPRQSGKSTLLQNLLKNYTYVSFDDIQMRNFFAEDPIGFMEQYDDKVIFDEVQKVPDLFNMLKIAVDKKRQQYGRYVVTGSSQFKFVRHISESLAGRIGLLSLLPFQFSELPKKSLQKISIYKGSYPELVMRKYQADKSWYSSYIDTYVNKDLYDISNIGNLRDFQRFLRLLAINTSRILNLSNYASDLGVSVPTIKNWISVLEASYIIFLLPSYHKNYGKRIIKSPKIYFYDTGLVSYLTAIKTQEQFIKGPMCGSIFENYIISEIMKNHLHNKTDAELFYYRASNGEEVDLIVEYNNCKDLIEIKHSSTSKTSMFETIKKIIEPKDNGYLLYNGKEFAYAKNIKSINYKTYLEKVNF